MDEREAGAISGEGALEAPLTPTAPSPPGEPAPRRELCAECGGTHSWRERCIDEVIPPPASPALIPNAARINVRRVARKRPNPLVQVIQWTLGFVAICTIIACTSIAYVILADLPLVDTDPERALMWLGVDIGVGVLIVFLLPWFVMRSFAKAMVGIVAVLLVTGGLALLCIAPVIRQMNTADIAEYRGSNAYYLFGAAATLAGVLLAALCTWWSMQREARRRIARWGRLLGSAAGVLVTLQGLTLLFALVSLFGEDATFEDTGIVERAISLTAVAMWFLVPGVLLAYHGISASMGEGSGWFRPPLPVLFAVVYVAVLALGQWNMAQESPWAWPMPVLHTIAAAMPGLAMASVAARGALWGGSPVVGVSWRQVQVAMAITMTLAVWIALYIEGFGSLYALVLLMVHNGAFKFAADSADALDIFGDSNDYLGQWELYFANLITAALLAPLAEEFAKSLGPRIMMRANTTRAQMFMMGAYAGAAFGFLEALLYGVAGIADGNLDGWWSIMLIRGGSTSGHVLWTGIGALSWWYWSRAKRHDVAAALMGAAMFGHAFWNGFAVTIDSRIFGLDTLGDDAIEIVAIVVLGAVTALELVAVPVLARMLREPQPPTVEGTPLAGMSAWSDPAAFAT
jgi:hypothetical protein